MPGGAHKKKVFLKEIDKFRSKPRDIEEGKNNWLVSMDLCALFCEPLDIFHLMNFQNIFQPSKLINEKDTKW